MSLHSDGTYKIFSHGKEYDFDADSGKIRSEKESLEEAILSVHPLFEDETYYTRTKVD